MSFVIHDITYADRQRALAEIESAIQSYIGATRYIACNTKLLSDAGRLEAYKKLEDRESLGERFAWIAFGLTVAAAWALSYVQIGKFGESLSVSFLIGFFAMMTVHPLVVFMWSGHIKKQRKELCILKGKVHRITSIADTEYVAKSVDSSVFETAFADPFICQRVQTIVNQSQMRAQDLDYRFVSDEMYHLMACLKRCFDYVHLSAQEKAELQSELSEIQGSLEIMETAYA